MSIWRYVAIACLTAVAGQPGSADIGRTLLRSQGDIVVTSYAITPTREIVIAGQTRSPDLGTGGAYQERFRSWTNMARIQISTRELTVLQPIYHQAIESIVMDPSDPDTVYAKPYSLNILFRSTNGGARWDPLFLGNDVVNLQGLWPMRSGLLALASTRIDGTRMMATFDRGDTWTDFGRVPEGGALYVDATRNCYAVTDSGAYRTADCGRTWIRTKAPSPAGRLAIHQDAPNRWFLIGPRAGGGGALFRSNDSGETWKTLPYPHPALWGLHVDANSSMSLYVPAFPNLVKSDDHGDSWRDTGVQPNYCGRPYLDFSSGTIFFSNSASLERPEITPGLYATNDGFSTVTKLLDYAPTAFDARHGIAYVTHPTSRDGFVAKYSASGELIFFTYFGGSEDDRIGSVAVDEKGDIYVGGWTNSPDFLTDGRVFARASVTDPAPAHGFIAKLSGDGKQLLYSARVPAPLADYPPTVAYANDGTIFALGLTRDQQLPAVGIGLYPYRTPTSARQSPDRYLIRLSAEGDRLLFSAAAPTGEFFDTRGRNTTSFAADGTTVYLYGGGSFRRWNTATGKEEWGTQGLPNISFDVIRTELAPGGGDLLFTGSQLRTGLPLDPFGAAQAAGVVFRLEAATGRIVSFHRFEGGAREFLTAAAIDEVTGELLVAGRTESGDIPTRGLSDWRWGAGEAQFGYYARSSAASGSAPSFATYLNWFTPVGFLRQPDGGLVLLGYGKEKLYGDEADGIMSVPIQREAEAAAGAREPRIDAVRWTSSSAYYEVDAFTAGRIISIRGAGFPSDAVVRLGGREIRKIAAVPREIVVAIPEDMPRGIATLEVTGAQPVRIRIF